MPCDGAKDSSTKLRFSKVGGIPLFTKERRDTLLKVVLENTTCIHKRILGLRRVAYFEIF